MLFLSACAIAAPATTQQADAKAEELLRQMTDEEKLSLVHADSKFSTAPIPRLGVPQRWLSDGPHGVREDVGPFSWNSANRTDDFVTAMPSLLSLAAAFDPDLARRYGETLGEEARARGKDILLGPSINIHRSPLCGRNFEYMGEDPLLAGHTSVAYIQGLQSRDVACSVKHYALNNQETQRSSIDVKVDERALREIYLPAFEASVKEGGALTVMGAYNKYLGQHACHNEVLLNQILKNEWGFKGLVVSDWSGVHNTREAALFGMDLEMGSDSNTRTYDQFFLAKPYLDGIRAGQFPMSTLDDKARRNLYVMAKTNVFAPDQRFKGSMNTRAHQATARQVAAAGAVLLKNEGNLLPLDRQRPPSVAVIGDFATRLQSAGGGAAQVKAFYEITPLAGLMNRFGPLANVTFSQGFRRPENQRNRRNTTGPSATQPAFDSAGVRIDPNAAAPASQPDEQLIARAVEAAKAADVAVIVGGIGHGRGYDEEGADRRDLRLPYGQDELIRRVVAANPKTIVVLLGGGPVDMPWLNDVPSVMHFWYGGMEAGNALADLLVGDANPGGKLPFTWPKQLSDSPAHALGAWPGANGVVEYKEGLFVGYRWFDEKKIEPLYPFGYGLSYTTFDCKNLTLTPGQDAAGLPTARLTCEVTNTGTRPGAQVVQAFVHDAESSLPRPPQELKGYTKVMLAPGETKQVTIDLPPRAFAFWNPAAKGWTAEAGKFEVRVGFSSRDIRQTQGFDLGKTVPVP
jgi:beta-glucosidase